MLGPSSRVFFYKIHDLYEIKMPVERLGSLNSGVLRSLLCIIFTSQVTQSSVGL